MGYHNPLLQLPAGKALANLPLESRLALHDLLMQLRAEANTEAETAWKRRKGPMAAYWRAVSTYARHTAMALRKGGEQLGRRRDQPQLPLPSHRCPSVPARDADDCPYCQGVACKLCGTSWMAEKCDHDAAERHWPRHGR